VSQIRLKNAEIRPLGLKEKRTGKLDFPQEKEWAVQDLNLRPPACKTDALPLS
jgi:hypothetical protein